MLKLLDIDVDLSTGLHRMSYPTMASEGICADMKQVGGSEMICANCGQMTIDLKKCSHCGASPAALRLDDAANGDAAAKSQYLPDRIGNGMMHVDSMDNSLPSMTVASSTMPPVFGHLVVHPDADNWGSTTEHAVPLDGRDVTIGRSSECIICLMHDLLVSRYHAIISHRDVGYVLADLGSSNGTLLNNMPVVDECLLRDGDVIRIGNCELVYSTALLPGLL